MRLSFLLAACTLIAGGCAHDESISEPPLPVSTALAPATPRSIIGTPIAMNGALYLRSDSGTFRLAGYAGAPLVSLLGAIVEVTGTVDLTNVFVVDAFAVRVVGGQPAVDGILVAVNGGYALRLVDGTLRALVDPPAGLIGYLGCRVWVAGPSDRAPVAFGVIY